jgi:hypothetical protein
MMTTQAHVGISFTSGPECSQGSVAANGRSTSKGEKHATIVSELDERLAALEARLAELKEIDYDTATHAERRRLHAELDEVEAHIAEIKSDAGLDETPPEENDGQ